MDETNTNAWVIEEKKRDFVKGFNILSILRFGPGKYPISKKLDCAARVMIDENGYIWLRNEYDGDSVRTTVNILRTKFSSDGCGGQEGIYVLCEDGTGLHFAEDDIYYIIDGEYSGWGPAYNHFKDFPDGDSRAASKLVEDAMLQWAHEHVQLSVSEDKPLGLKYDWTYLIELGYTVEELEEYENEGWSESILETLTNPDMTSTYQNNVAYMLKFFDKDELFRFMIRYTSAFMISNELFISRIEQIEYILGESWTQNILEQYWEDNDSILCAVGYLCDSDWNDALDALDVETNDNAGI